MKLLIQSCSGKKTATAAQLPAFDLYDGVNYRVIKKFFRENPGSENDIVILIISAEYGLIASTNLIPTYDRRMNKSRAEELKTLIRDQWQNLSLDIRRFDQILINAGRDYERAMSLINLGHCRKTAGGIGQRMSQLKSWLTEK